MEIGYTIPLQKYLHTGALPYGAVSDRRFLWDAHVISLYGAASLLLVHCSSRYTVVLYSPSHAAWRDIDALAVDAIRKSLLAEGIPSAVVSGYLTACDAARPMRTRTHGRREVAFLNRAWEYVAASDALTDRAAVLQDALRIHVNDEICHCAGYDGYGTPRERLHADLHPFYCDNEGAAL